MDAQGFVLTAAQLSEAFAAAGCVPLPGDFPEDFPAAGGFSPEASVGADAVLDLMLLEMLDTLSHPDISLRVARTEGGEGGGPEDCILRIRGDRYVALSRCGPGLWRIEALAGRAAMMARIERLSGQASGAGTEQARLGSPTAGFCGHCGTLFGDSPAFCRECGESLR